MNKLIKLFLVAVLSIFTFISCSDDDSDTSVIGNWEYTKTIVTKINNKSVNYDITDLIDINGSMEFYENGTCKLIYGDVVDWKYTNNETAIELYFPIEEEDKEEGKPDVDTQVLPFTLSGNEMIFVDNDFDIDNSDEYPEEGMMSFSEFEKLFNENISSESEITVSVKIIFLRK
ncbi:hypothetical protein [Marinifilum sp. D737]|uniref:hypothetical protein n=1 Tax=Marinifilum sp. D737 TaxID=2969628 RepID=UPI0022752149|nr:hypothetical protein [Marinifilum sp. D737]MCY1634527.1 hypothetical protein [Marinifilum sp. D737]